MADRFTHAVGVRLRDLDPRGHVNHAVYVSYLEQARSRFFADVLGDRLGDVNTVMRDLRVEYERPIEHGDPVEVAVGVAALGETSLTLSYEVTAGGDPAATARTVSVLLDDGGRPTPLPDAWRDRAAAYLAG